MSEEQPIREKILSPQRALDIGYEILGRDLVVELGNKHPEIAYKIGQIQKKTAEEQITLTLAEFNRRLIEIKNPYEPCTRSHAGFSQAIQAMKEMLK
jgi:hypothetical protein